MADRSRSPRGQSTPYKTQTFTNCTFDACVFGTGRGLFEAVQAKHAAPNAVPGVLPKGMTAAAPRPAKGGGAASDAPPKPPPAKQGEAASDARPADPKPSPATQGQVPSNAKSTAGSFRKADGQRCRAGKSTHWFR